MIKGRLYDELRRSLVMEDGIAKVELDEDWNPPHKPAAFSPYDAVVTLEDTETHTWTKESFEQLLEDKEVTLEKVISFEPKEKRDPIQYEVFLSLATAEAQGLVAPSDD